ncbi:MAG TPA: selenoneine biosynthesis selenosugar synthase SenB [Burkholderiales bacterium]|nr:selenoneine biosynthesis selenosugar synthase SenB [Burkholderiales bacterium]
MNIALITPARPVAHSGNRNTAERWATLLRELGHRVRTQTKWDGKAADVMIALHARRSHESIARFAAALPGRPLVVMLTGTDLYADIRIDTAAKLSLKLATRLVILQDEGLSELLPSLRPKTRVIYQSTQIVKKPPPLKTKFEVCISGHLREVKDPFRLASALGHLPKQSRVRVTQIGGAMSPSMREDAQRWMRHEPRYHWMGEVPHGTALKRLARSRLMVISSRMEGGANVVTEALAARVPVIASRVSGNIGMLGKDYAGYFPFGNERALASVLWRAESDAAFYSLLQRQCRERCGLTRRSREKNALRLLMRELESCSVNSRRRATRAPAQKYAGERRTRR